MSSFRQIWQLLKEAFQEWQDDNAMQLAAALAFYTLLSLAPALMIIMAVAGVVFGRDAARGELVTQIQGHVGIQAANLIESLVAQASQGSSVLTVIGVGSMIFGSTIVFAALQDALNAIWDVTPKPGKLIRLFFKKRILSFALVVGIGLLLLSLLVASAALTAASKFFPYAFPIPSVLLEGANLLVSFGITTLLFAIMYKVLPDVHIAWSDVWLGAGVTSLLFTIGKLMISLYLGRSAVGSAYGAAGSFVLLLVWVYYSAQVFFLGAEFTQVYARNYGSGIVPDENVARVVRKIEIHDPNHLSWPTKNDDTGRSEG